MFQKKICREHENTQFMLNNFLLKSSPLRENVEKYSRNRQATDDNTPRPMRFVCWTNFFIFSLTNSTYSL